MISIADLGSIATILGVGITILTFIVLYFGKLIIRKSGDTTDDKFTEIAGGILFITLFIIFPIFIAYLLRIRLHTSIPSNYWIYLPIILGILTIIETKLSIKIDSAWKKLAIFLICLGTQTFFLSEEFLRTATYSISAGIIFFVFLTIIALNITKQRKVKIFTDSGNHEGELFEVGEKFIALEKNKVYSLINRDKINYIALKK
jgi:hypothetical protein